eukprot:4249815-Alexandrium_andersonii.AAC.1
MSASLVGSEMCIRDSSIGRAGSSPSLPRRPRQRGQRLSHRNGAAPAAVSYTHLTLPTICSV